MLSYTVLYTRSWSSWQCIWKDPPISQSAVLPTVYTKFQSWCGV